MKQANQDGQIVHPGQLLDDTAQGDDMQRARTLDQRRGSRGKPGQPTEDVRIAPQLRQVLYAGIMFTQIAEKIFGRGPIAAFGRVAHRSSQRPNGAEEHFGQWMHQWQPDPLHD
jgi:hypothetical protein